MIQLTPGIYTLLQAKLKPKVEKLIAKYNKIKDSKTKLETIYNDIDNGFKGKKLSCGKGCSACCHLIVSISEDEATNIANLIKEDPSIVDIEQMKKHKNYDYDPNHWNSMSWEERKCPFLSNNECSIYENRPINCRTYNSSADRKYCDNKQFDKVNREVSEAAELAVSAYINQSNWGIMARMIYPKLVKEEQNEPKN